MSITFGQLKTFYRALLQKMKDFRGNWEQNDPTADDYIKNRPFYSKIEEYLVLPETTVHCIAFGTTGNPFSVILKKGEKYTVTFDGNVYQCIARETYDNEPFIGNSSILGWNDDKNTGEPFFIDVMMDNGYSDVTFAANTDGPHVISITRVNEIVKQIDEKFVPVNKDAVGEYVEEFTAPKYHVSSYDEYGSANYEFFGHVRLTDSVVSTSDTYGGFAATPAAVKTAYDIANMHQNKNNNPHRVTAAQIGAAPAEHEHNYLQYVEKSISSGSSASGIAYGNGVAIIATMAGIYYSTDLIEWTARSSAGFNGIAFGNNKFVAVGENGASRYWNITGNLEKDKEELDGVPKTAKGLPTGPTWGCIAFGNNKFVAVERSTKGSNVAVYADATGETVTWNAIQLPRSDYWFAIAFGNGKFVLKPENGNCLVSEDGITWVESNNSPCSGIGIGYGNGLFFAVGNRGRTSYSEDGMTWESGTSVSDQYNFGRMCYGNGVYIACCAESYSRLAYSYDGRNWRTIIADVPSSVTGVVFADGLFISVRSTGTIYNSVDGITWSREFKGFVNNGRFFDPRKVGLLTSDYVVLYSPNRTKYKLTVNDSGELSAVVAAE